jgi:hypothetical protein
MASNFSFVIDFSIKKRALRRIMERPASSGHAHRKGAVYSKRHPALNLRGAAV